MTTDNIHPEDVRYIPHRCEVCQKIPGQYSGMTIPEGAKPPVCENHKRQVKAGRLTIEQVTMVPVAREGLRSREFESRLMCARMGGYVDRATGWCPGHTA